MMENDDALLSMQTELNSKNQLLKTMIESRRTTESELTEAIKEKDTYYESRKELMQSHDETDLSVIMNQV